MTVNERIWDLLVYSRTKGIEVRCMYIGHQEKRDLMTQQGAVNWTYLEDSFYVFGVPTFVVNEAHHLNVSTVDPTTKEII